MRSSVAWPVTNSENLRLKSPARHRANLQAEAAQNPPGCSTPRRSAAQEAACAQPIAPAPPAIPSIWRAPHGTIPSEAVVQSHAHPCDPSSPSSLIMPPSHAASPAEWFQNPACASPACSHCDNGPASSPIRFIGKPSPLKKETRASGSLRASPPSRFRLAHPQRKRSTVPMTRRFQHNVPRLSSVSICLGPTRVVTPFHHLSGDGHINRSFRAGPITASSGFRVRSAGAQ